MILAVAGALLIGALGLALIVDALAVERRARPETIIDLTPRVRRATTTRRSAPSGRTPHEKAVEYVDHGPDG